MSTYDKTDRGAYVALGVIFGMAAGIGAGMLMAPRSGEETRSQMRERAMDAKQKARRQLEAKRAATMEVVSKSLDKSKDVVDKAADKTKGALDKASDRAAY